MPQASRIGQIFLISPELSMRIGYIVFLREIKLKKLKKNFFGKPYIGLKPSDIIFKPSDIIEKTVISHG